MRMLTGIAADGRRAWLISARRDEWVLVDAHTYADLQERMAKLPWQNFVTAMGAGLIDLPIRIILDLRALEPMVMFLLMGLALWLRGWAWRRRLAAAGEHCIGGVRLDEMDRARILHESWKAMVVLGSLQAAAVAALWLSHQRRPLLAVEWGFLAILLIIGNAWLALQRRGLRRLAQMAEPVAG